MKKLSTGTDLGGAPITKADLRQIFNFDLWDAIDGIMSVYDSHTEGVIVSGCVFSNNAGNFDMTAGIVYLNGEFMRVPAVTNQAYTKYIQPDTIVNDTRTFNDGGSHIVSVDKPAKVAAGIPGLGQYVTIDSLTGANDRRLGKANTAWTNIASFGTDWGAGSPAAQYMIDITGMAHLRGYAKTTLGGATSNFRITGAGGVPSVATGNSASFPKHYSLHGGGGYLAAPAFVSVEDDGSMFAFIPNGTPSPTNIDAEICLDGISYMAKI